jgi:hypothetical protein
MTASYDTLGVWGGWQDGKLPQYWPGLSLHIFQRDGFTCGYCHKRFGHSDLVPHHRQPKERGGSDNPRNLVTVCHHCHECIHTAEALPDCSAGCGCSKEKKAVIMGDTVFQRPRPWVPTEESWPPDRYKLEEVMPGVWHCAVIRPPRIRPARKPKPPMLSNPKEKIPACLAKRPLNDWLGYKRPDAITGVRLW